MNRYDRYPGDYLRHTLTLTPAQDGMYTRLMDYYYSTERAIPKDEAMAAARCRNADDESVTQWVLDRFFTSTDSGYRHDRIEQEIEKARPRIEAAKRNGIKGGRPKRNPAGSSRVSQQEPSDNPGRKLPSPSPSPSKSVDQELSDSLPLILTDSPVGERDGRRAAARFGEFWAVYPVRKGKAAALATWTRKGLDGIADRIIGDVTERKAQDRQWLDGYAPHASTYVNQRGWEDDVEKPNGGNHATGTRNSNPGYRLSAIERVQKSISDRLEREHDEATAIAAIVAG